MPYTKSQALDFWYDYDQRFLFAPPPEVPQLYQTIYGPDNFSFDVMVDRVRDASNEQDLANKLTGRETAILRLAELQVELMDLHFPDSEDLQKAFEDFGHGVLFDNKRDPSTSQPRRQTGRLVHMMDDTPDRCVGYHRWHAFIRAAIAVGADRDIWLKVNRLVTLAWSIYSELDPVPDSHSNPKLRANRVKKLRDAWLKADTATLNAAFITYSGSFPNDYGSRRTKHIDEVRWTRIQKILSDSASSGFPSHGGQGSFWNLPLSEIVRLSIYGNPLIAPSGPNRGEKSALVKVLRGTLPGFPRMPPIPRPPVPDPEIKYIEDWIDNLDIA